MKPGVKNVGTKYWEYVSICVDNILCISHAPGVVMECIPLDLTISQFMADGQNQVTISHKLADGHPCRSVPEAL
eukprot:10361806-Ditylum_brightwellii.AAC.1